MDNLLRALHAYVAPVKLGLSSVLPNCVNDRTPTAIGLTLTMTNFFDLILPRPQGEGREAELVCCCRRLALLYLLRCFTSSLFFYRYVPCLVGDCFWPLMLGIRSFIALKGYQPQEPPPECL